VAYTPYGNIAATNVQTAISELDDEKEPVLTKGNLVENITGLEWSATRQVIGGTDTLKLTAGYAIPSATQVTNMVTASSTFGTDNSILRADGTARGAKSAGLATIDNSNNMIVGGSITNNGNYRINAAQTNNGFDWKANGSGSYDFGYNQGTGDFRVYLGESAPKFWVKQAGTVNINSFTGTGNRFVRTDGNGDLTATVKDSSLYWGAGYRYRLQQLTTTGTSGAATFSGNVLNIPNYTLSGLGYTIPSLQQVTAVGDTTNHSITAANYYIKDFDVYTGYGMMYSGLTGLIPSPVYSETGISGEVRIGRTSDAGAFKFQLNGKMHTMNQIYSHEDGSTDSSLVRLSQVKQLINDSVNATNWNAAYSWGNHASAGYITDGNSGWDNSYGFITDGNSGWDNSYGFITSYTETDPTIYSWAKAATKPAYTWSEITDKPTFATVATSGSYNDLSDKPTIPTNTNQLTNGAGFITDGNTGWDNSYGFITSETDGSVTNEGVLSVGAADGFSSYLQTSTSGGNAVTFNAGSGMTISETVSGNGGQITFTNNAPDQTVSITNGAGLSITGTYPSFTASIGTPSSISYSSANSASGSTHSHALSISGTPSAGDVINYSEVYGLAWTPPVTGTGTSTYVAFWSGNKSLSSDADYSYNSTSNTLTVGSGSGNGSVTSGNFILSSDRRLKERIERIPDLNWVDKIDFKTFRFKNDESKRQRYGVIAQEVEKINPELVFTDENGNKSVGYIDLLIAKVARQDEIINELIKRIEKLENEK
jgi:hypothetical protein